jgi:hypothetical protein
LGIGNDFEAALHQVVTDTRHEIDELELTRFDGHLFP